MNAVKQICENGRYAPDLEIHFFSWNPQSEGSGQNVFSKQVGYHLKANNLEAKGKMCVSYMNTQKSKSHQKCQLNKEISLNNSGPYIKQTKMLHDLKQLIEQGLNISQGWNI